MTHAPRLFRLDRDNSDASRLFLKAVLVIDAVASAFCGLLRRERHGNQMKAQHKSKAESAKRHYTAKRMILLLRRFNRFVTNGVSFMTGQYNQNGLASFDGHEPFPRATESQSASQSSGKKGVNFHGLDFSQVARHKFRCFCQFNLHHFLRTSAINLACNSQFG